MKSTPNSTRVPAAQDSNVTEEVGTAPDILGVASDSVSCETYAEATLNPLGRGVSNCYDVTPQHMTAHADSTATTGDLTDSTNVTNTTNVTTLFE